MIHPTEFMAQCKVVLLGSSFAGKTSILRRLVFNKFNNDYASTLGTSLSTYDCQANGQSVRLNVWDTAGQENYRSLAKVYYRDANAAMIVYDVTSAESFKDIEYWISELDSSDSIGYSITIVANKIDMRDKRLISEETGKAFAEKVGASYAEVSALTGEGVRLLFDSIATKFVQIRDDPKKNRRYSDLHTVQTSNVVRKNESRCC